MTGKERMMIALKRLKPDRLPVTVHQWQGYHLETFMNGMSALDAFKFCGMDAAIQYFKAMDQFWIPDAEQYIVQTTDRKEAIEVISGDRDNKILHHTITTPGGKLTYKTGGNRTTTWITEYLIKHHEDIDLIDKYMPVAKLNQSNISRTYDELGDAGILRGFVWGDQAGCWQHACCLMNFQQLIIEAYDSPEWVHRLLNILLRKKLRFIEESFAGAKFDLIETGAPPAIR